MSCSRCGFQHNCICHTEPRLSSKARFILLTHPKELGKDTNTGELMLRTLPDSQRYTWDRVNPPAALLDEIRASGNQPWLLFPCDEKHPATVYQSEPDKQPLFILLDATWQEARKMVRKSPWLAQLPRLSLNPSSASAYQLRRNQQAGNLCTCEAGIALLEMLGEAEQAVQLNDYFQAFIDTFHADKSGHTKQS
ncbi:tRNA-uridine aminocarboxypropyltransferase [Photobacterium sp. OFAV2-7]|uniref:tRNA-uridine aminocarboxypropyltransferase n=1 Tax=Photobacterium sp. OFAV2-7 TaxID=2917748 RepID=UPI001EF3E833|nr:DTW domain-containing protein [Photobacterium sp. OFAV2-7]MCG7584182.1 DTW domain-containing protein [Photobacterium sp. OFAV2-7]